MRKQQRWGAIAALLVLPLTAAAGHQLCGKTEVPASLRRCPDGSIPVYVADQIKPYVAPQILNNHDKRVARDATPQQQPKPSQAASGDVSSLFGVWRTNVPGAVWTSPSGYQGQDWLHVSAGAAAGDLIIKPDGTYVWASYGGKKGRWVAGNGGYPLVLIDTVEKRRWQVGFDPKRTGGRQIVIWDGNAFYYDGRK